MLIRVQELQGQFAGLPAKLRKRFSNNPENMLRFLEDPKNAGEAVKLGLLSEDDVDPKVLQQQNLVAEAEAKDKADFEAWKKQRAADLAEAEHPPRADEEAQPRFQPKKRTR